jgi:hypothetical protein
VLPDYKTCVDRIRAYTQVWVYRTQIEQKRNRPPKIRFRDFWNYKVGLEDKGCTVLDSQHLGNTSSILYHFLESWGMKRTGIAQIHNIERILRNVRQDYYKIHRIELGSKKICHYRANIEAIYAGLDGITNLEKYPNGSRSYITGKSKTLLAIWGQTPGFDRLTRKNFLRWTHPPAPLDLNHLRRGEEWYTPSQFCDMIVQLDEWVFN